MDAGSYEFTEGEERDTPFKRWVSLAASVVAFCASIVVVLEAHAAERADHMTREAQLHSLESWNRTVAATGDWLAARVPWLDARVFEGLHVAGRQAVVEPSLRTVPQYALAEAWRDVQRNLSPVSSLLQKSEYRASPDSYLFDRLGGAEAEFLRQDAALNTGEEWERKAGRYIGILTFLAVSLLLLGLSATFAAGSRWALLVSGGTLAGICLLAMGFTAVSRIPTTDDDAILGVARGDVSLAMGEFGKAITAYSNAIELDHDYATAYGMRAGAHFAAGSPETDPYYVSITSPEALQATIDDAERALELGSDDPFVINSLSAAYFHTHRYEEALEEIEYAIALSERIPLFWMNRGLYLAAMGNESDARAAYLRAFELAASDDADRYDRPSLFATARTTLEQLRDYRTERTPLIDRLLGLLAVLQAEMDPSDEIFTATHTNEVALSASFAPRQILATVESNDIPQGSKLSWVVYRRVDRDQPWQSVGYWFDNESPFPNPAHLETGCLSAGQFRVDLFINGWLAARTMPEPLTSTFQPYQDPGFLGADLCFPDGWTVAKDDDRHWVTFTSPRASAALALAAVPSAPSTDTGYAQRQAAAIVSRLPGSWPSSGDLDRHWKAGPIVMGEFEGRTYSRGQKHVIAASTRASSWWTLWLFVRYVDGTRAHPSLDHMLQSIRLRSSEL
jgi:tetratricopeptide (TPR) repeat protein